MKILVNRLFGVFFFIFLLGGVFLFNIPNSEAVGDAYFPQATTLQITVGGTLTSYTITAGSDADSLVVNPSSFAVTISTGESFSVTSVNGHQFVNDSGYVTNCSSGLGPPSTLSISVSGTQKTVTVTPDGSIYCSAGSSGSSGGGGGSGYVAVSTPLPSAIPSATQSLTPTPTPASTSISITPTPPASPAKYNFTRGLHFGMSGDDVKALQDYLRVLGFYNNPNSTGFFDTPTKKAVINWQKKNKILANGSFGPLSRAKYNQMPLPLEVVPNNTLELKPGIKFLNVRTNPSTKAKVVSKLKAGQQVHFVDVQNGWYKVQNVDGGFGWVLGRYTLIK